MSKDIKREQLLEVLFDFQKLVGCADSEMIANLIDGCNNLNVYASGYVNLRAITGKLLTDMTLLLNGEFDDDCLEDDDEEFTGFKKCTCKPDYSSCVGTLGEHNAKMEEDIEDEVDSYIKDMLEDYEGTYYDLDGMDTDGDIDPDVIEDVDEDESYNDYYEEEFDDETEEHECSCGGNCGGEDHECKCGGNCGDNCKCKSKVAEDTDEEFKIYKPTTEELVDAIMTENEELQKWQALEMLYSPIESLTEEQLIDLRRVYDRALLYLSENYKYKTVEEFIKAKHAIIRLNMDDLTLKDLGIKIVNEPIVRDDEEEGDE